jgi:hypothetical protein
MRNMSSALTTQQVKARTKTVTRRLGWKAAKVGDVIQPVVKGMGLKKGETVEKIGGPIRIVRVSREPLSILLNDVDGSPYGRSEIRLEGFGFNQPPHLHHSVTWFVEMFCEHNGCTPDAEVTRIEFEYV